MLLPFAEYATVDIGKLRDYCLNPNHEAGKQKARVFADDARDFAARILIAVKENDAVAGVENEYGKRYTVDFAYENGDKAAVVRSVWIIEPDSKVPRLITCYVM